MTVGLSLFLRSSLVVLVAATLSSCTRSIEGVANFSASNPPSVEWVSDPEASDTLISVTLRGSGRFHVGADFPPGMYQSNGSTGRSLCVWRRVAAGAGDRRVVESGIGDGPQRVVIEPTDSTFLTASCLPWRKVH